MKNRQPRDELSGPAGRLAGYFQHHPRTVFVRQRHEQSAAAAKTIKPERSRVRHTCVDEDRIDRPWIIIGPVGDNDGHVIDPREIGPRL
jgi:hypothetical protein